MIKVSFSLQSTCPMSQSRDYTDEVPKGPKESHEDYEVRTWKERLHTTKDGFVFIPPMTFKFGLSTTAKFLGLKRSGSKGGTWTKFFEAGVSIMEPLITQVHRDAVTGEWFRVPSDGKRQGSSRVRKCFPLIPEWSGTLDIIIIDETMSVAILKEHMEAMGIINGVGRFRPQQGGFKGRFKVVGHKVLNAI